jgi:hypothetical protein
MWFFRRGHTRRRVNSADYQLFVARSQKIKEPLA